MLVLLGWTYTYRIWAEVGQVLKLLTNWSIWGKELLISVKHYYFYNHISGESSHLWMRKSQGLLLPIFSSYDFFIESLTNWLRIVLKRYVRN